MNFDGLMNGRVFVRINWILHFIRDFILKKKMVSKWFRIPLLVSSDSILNEIASDIVKKKTVLESLNGFVVMKKTENGEKSRVKFPLNRIESFNTSFVTK